MGLGGMMGGLGYDLPLTMGNYASPLSQISGVPSLQSMSDSLPGMHSDQGVSGFLGSFGNALKSSDDQQVEPLGVRRANAQAMPSTGLLQRLLAALSQGHS